MKRLWIVIGVSLALLLALFGVRNFDSSAEPSDEILAYEVTADSSVSVTLSGGIERVLLNSWLVVPIDAAEPLFPYGIEMVVSTLDGEQVLSRRFETRTRLSDIEGDRSPHARVADAKAWVCEPRSFELETDALGGRAGVLRVRALPGNNSRVLLRMTHKAARGDWERQIIERALGPVEMRRLMAGRSSLGFFDLPVAQRMDALGYWERRLTAQGSEGRDYQSRRLLIGAPGPALREERWRDGGIDTSPEQYIALNLTSALALRLHAEVGTAFFVQDGAEGAITRHVVAEASGLDLQFPDAGLRTVTLYAETPRHVALSAPTPQGWLFGEPPALVDDRFEVLPDVRKRNHYRLDPERPLVVSTAPEQPWVGFDVRAELASGVPNSTVEFSARWLDAQGHSLGDIPYRALAERSFFERLDTTGVTDLATVRLRVPDGAARLELRGQSRFAAAAFVPEPAVPVAVRSPPYDIEPAEGLVWRYSPQSLTPIAGVRPDNLSDLRMQGRELVLYEQVRMEPIEGRGLQVVPRLLTPLERTTERALLAWVTPSQRGTAFSSAAPWVVLSAADKVSRLRFEPARGSAAPAQSPAEFEWTILAPKQALGEPWSVSIDDKPLLDAELAFTTARGNELIAAGEHTVSLQASPDVLLAVRARPLTAGAGSSQLDSFKQQSVVLVPAQGALTFPFARQAGELLSLVVVLARQGKGDRAELIARIDDGKPKTHTAFFHRETAPETASEVVFGQYGRGIVWDAANGGHGKSPDDLARVVIPVGDDLSVGRHTLTVRFSGLRADDQVWVRAVAVGRRIDPAQGGEISLPRTAPTTSSRAIPTPSVAPSSTQAQAPHL